MTARTYGPYVDPKRHAPLTEPPRKWTRMVLQAESIDDGRRVTREAVAPSGVGAYGAVSEKIRRAFGHVRYRNLDEGLIVEFTDPPAPQQKPTRCAW